MERAECTSGNCRLRSPALLRMTASGLDRARDGEMRRLWLAFCVLACGAVIAGCAAAPKTLPPDQLATFRLAGVNVAFDPDARIAWGDGELAYVASKGLPSTEVDQAAAT